MNPRIDPELASEKVDFAFTPSRRDMVKLFGAGLLITVLAEPAGAQRRPGGGGRGQGVSARVHIGRDGAITVFTGKVEGGQGARAQLTLVAAEELRVAPARIAMVMGDTDFTPDDGITAGSRTTPSTVPAVRRGAAAARAALVDLAAGQWNVPAGELEARDGAVTHAASGRKLSYGELASLPRIDEAMRRNVPDDIAVTPLGDWKVMGKSYDRPNQRDLVTGVHRYPSDTVRPGMLYGKVLRPPSYGARMTGIDLAPARAMKDVVVVQDGSFVGVAAPTAWAAEQALAAIAKTATWEPAPHPSSTEVYDYLRKRARGGVPANPFAQDLAAAKKALKQTYHVAYVQHVPLEPRAAVAEWNDGKLTVWTGSQAPFGVKSELTRAFNTDRVRVIVPDFGSGYGGKHTGEYAVEAARLAKAAGKPVCLRWTRQEEFTWAYYRPAAVIDVEAGLDEKGTLTSWHFININSGGAALDTPYRAGRTRCQFVNSDSPMRQGSYRALASVANNFARECFMDELAEAAGRDPLEFRLAHLDNPRIRAVLESAAQRFDWAGKRARKEPYVGVGLACGTEKGSVVATCVEIAMDAERGIVVRHVCEVFECGPVINPENCLSQVSGCILMGLGPALREEMLFEGGKVTNATFTKYRVPTFRDVPTMDLHLLDRPEISPVGAGETPIIGIAPAIANAVFHATGKRIHSMPIRPPA